MIHGEYINDYRCFKNTGRVSKDGALKLVLNSEYCTPDDIEDPSREYLWLNKGWFVTSAVGGTVHAVYLHDGYYYKYIAQEVDFIREFVHYPGPKRVTSLEEFKTVMQERRERKAAFKVKQ